MKAIKATILALTLGMSAAASAIPNMWDQGYGMGWVEYNIETDNNVRVSMACNVGNDYDDSDPRHTLNVTLANGVEIKMRDDKKEITFVADGESAAVPPFLGWRNGDESWYRVMNILTSGNPVDVYIDTKKVTTIKASKKNIDKVLDDLKACSID